MCNSSPFHLIQVSIYRDKLETSSELAFAPSDDVHHSIGQFGAIWGCISKMSKLTPQACDKFQSKICLISLIKICDKGLLPF